MDEPEVFRVTVGPKGRVVIPARLRRELGIEEGEVLSIMLSEEGDSLELISPDAALKRIRRMFAEKVPPGVDLVQELIDERRAEAERELREYEEEVQRWSAEQRRTGS
jgi:AbrB family looped-hinge helix DNA binding protein